MKTLDLFSEPFAPTGNIAAEGFRNLLGRPALGLLPTVVRESVQNSVDAASGSSPQILIRVRTLDEAQSSFLAQNVLAIPEGAAASLGSLRNVMAKRLIPVMEICDFGTSGLGGPTRADLVVEDEDPDFVNFMRNVGSPRDTHHGGGTYGYGKTSLYAMSSCATILVDTAATCDRKSVRRLMAAHLGGAFEKGQRGSSIRKRFTGRHWWGVLDAEEGIDPLHGEAAADMSSRLGLPGRRPEDTGTSIVIIDPQFDNTDPCVLADELVEIILWNFWPRMMRTVPKDRRLIISLEVEGKRISIPAPEDFPPLDLFSQALAEIDQPGDQARTIICQRPAKVLGSLSICRGATAQRVGPALRLSSAFNAPSARIALMRPVGLVVRYIDGEPFPDARFEWAGVFRCSDDDDVEAAFAKSEPPAHEDWVPENLPKGREKTWVRVALREIESAARSYVAPSVNPSTSTERGPSLAQAASRLGALLGDVSSQGPGKPRSVSNVSPSSRRDVAVSSPVFLRLVEMESSIQAVFLAEVRNDIQKPNLKLRANAYVVADGGAAGLDDLPSNLSPRVVSITHEESGLEVTGDRFSIGLLTGRFRIMVSMTSDAAVGIKLNIEEETV